MIKSSNEVLKKITLDHTFDAILKILKLPKNKSEETKRIIEHYRKLTRPYLGPHPYTDTDFAGGFGFYIVTSSHNNRGEPVKECEGYPHLPYKIDEIIHDQCRNLDWYNFGISEYFLDKITLDTPINKINCDLEAFLMKTTKEYKSYGLPLLDNYKQKLDETQEFIIKRISEYRDLIEKFVEEVKN